MINHKIEIDLATRGVRMCMLVTEAAVSVSAP